MTVRKLSGKRWTDWPLATKALVVIAVPLAPLFLTTTLFYVAEQRERAAELASARAADTYADLHRTLMLVVERRPGDAGGRLHT